MPATRSDPKVYRLEEAILALAAEDLAASVLLPDLHHALPKAYKEAHATKLRTIVAQFLPQYNADKVLTFGPDKRLVSLGRTASSTLGTPFMGQPMLRKIDSFTPSIQKLPLDFSEMDTRYAGFFGEALGHLYAPGYKGLTGSERRAVKNRLKARYERLRQGYIHDIATGVVEPS